MTWVGRELLGMPNASPLVVFRSSQFYLIKYAEGENTGLIRKILMDDYQSKLAEIESQSAGLWNL